MQPLRSLLAMTSLTLVLSACGEPRRYGDAGGLPVTMAVHLERAYVNGWQNRQAQPSAGAAVGFGSGGSTGVGVGLGLSFSSTQMYLLGGDQVGQGNVFHRELKWGDNSFSVPLAAGECFHRDVPTASVSSVRAAFDLPDHYILFVGTLEPRKNLSRLLDAFAAALQQEPQLPALVIAGMEGWQVNGIVQAQTGFPLTVIDPQTGIRYLTNRPDQICDPNEDAPGTVEQWFTTSCFARRAIANTAEPGTTPRNSVRGPGFARTDLSVFRNITLTGPHQLQLRVEVFNAFNQTRFGQPGGQIGTATFGRITTSEDGRILQLAVKYSF